MLDKDSLKNYLREVYEFSISYPKNVGSKIYELEETFKAIFHFKYASACTSGSTALFLALKSLGVKSDDEILLNSNYFISDPNAITICGCKPIFIDMGNSLNSLSIKNLKSKITNKTKAIILIHLNGYPIENTEEIIKICHKNNIKVIEDCCQSVGAKIGNKYIGNFGDIAIFSFDSNKLIKGGEGGMIGSNNLDLIERTRSLKNNCKQDNHFMELGYNFRYNDFSAIYAKYSLLSIGDTLKNRQRIFLEIQEVLSQKNMYENYITYKYPEDVFPVFYNIILQTKTPLSLLKSKDHYNINYRKLPNLIKIYQNYFILELPKDSQNFDIKDILIYIKRDEKI